MKVSKISAPIDDLLAFVNEKKYSGEVLDHEALKFSGIFILRKALPKHLIEKYSRAYFQGLGSIGLRRTPFHLTQVEIQPDHPLTKIVYEPEFLAIAATFFNGNVGNDFIRIVKKDDTDTLPVFLHQDTCYQIGGFERYSLFIALTDCNQGNGGLRGYPGTHNFGYLGDAGEIADLLPEGYPVICTDLKAGDLFIMHSAIWHESFENISRSNRVYLEVHLQSADEPTTNRVICGQRNSEWRFEVSESDIFVSSRKTKLTNLYAEIQALKLTLDSTKS
jgi:hypothetical protein